MGVKKSLNKNNQQIQDSIELLTTISGKSTGFTKNDIFEAEKYLNLNFTDKLIYQISKRALSEDSRIILFPTNPISKKIVEKFSSKYTLFEVDKVNSILDLNPTHIVICADEAKVESLLLLNTLDWKDRYPEIILAGISHQISNQLLVEKIEESKGIESFAVGYDYTKAHIYESLNYIYQNKIPGAIVELGTYRGGTLKLILALCKKIGFKPTPPIYGFDAWDGHRIRHSLLDLFDFKDFISNSQDLPTDIENLTKSINRENPKGNVEVSLVKGDISITFPHFLKTTLTKNKTPLTNQVAFAFIDTDNYFAVKESLNLLVDKMPKGGILLFDHYYTKEAYSNTIGEHCAMVEFLKKYTAHFFNLTGTGVFIKL